LPFWLEALQWLLRKKKSMGAGSSAAKSAVKEIEAASAEKLGAFFADLSEDERQKVLRSLAIRPKFTVESLLLDVYARAASSSLELVKHAEARCVSEELFNIIDKDRSRKISRSEFTAAQQIIAQVSEDLLPAAISKLDENEDGEVDRAEWDQWMGAAFRSLKPETFLDVCVRSLRRLRDATGDSSRLHPWIDLDFSSLGQKRHVISGAEKRGITLPQLQKLMRFLTSHADGEGNLQGWWDRFTLEPLCIAKMNLYTA